MKADLTMRAGRLVFWGFLAVLAACSASRPKPVDIPPVAVLQQARTAWTAQIGKVNFPLSVAARDDRIALANSDGTVAMLNAKLVADGLEHRHDGIGGAAGGGDDFVVVFHIAAVDAVHDVLERTLAGCGQQNAGHARALQVQ